MENTQEKSTNNTPTFFIPVENETCKIIPFPKEHKSRSAIPNLLIRSNLFGIKKDDKKFHDGKVLVTQGDKRIVFRGQQLNQVDLDVWLVLKKAFIEKPVGEKVDFSTKEILKFLGMHQSQNNRKWLQRKVDKLCTSMLKFDHVGYGSENIMLVENVRWKNKYDSFELGIHKHLINLFEGKNYTYVDIKTRRELKSHLAKWLFNYWSSHKNQYDIYVSKIAELCGSDFNRIRDFKRKLIIALKQLQEIGFIQSYSIDKSNKLSIKIKVNKKTSKVYNYETHSLPLEYSCKNNKK